MASTWGQTVTVALVYLAAVVERADEQILPSLYFFIGKSLNATPADLGAVTLCRALVQAISSPLSGLLGDRYDRTMVISGGCFLWGIMTAALGLATSIHEAMVYAACNGVGLALVIPCSQSLIADFYTPEVRGRAFGLMQLIGALGVMLGGLFATNVGHYTPMGIEGWRFAVELVAALSMVTGFLVLKYAVDPRRQHLAPKAYKPIPQEDPGDVEAKGDATKGEQRRAVTRGRSNMPSSPVARPQAGGGMTKANISKQTLGGVWRDVRWMLSIRTFQAIIAQGVVGSMPWNAMVFFTLWFQLMGFSDLGASTLVAVFHMGCAIGAFAGGVMGDCMSLRFPNAGRIMTAQISVFSGLPLSALLLKVLPAMGLAGDYGPFAVVMFSLGFMIPWCSPGCNSPIFAEIVPEEMYSRVYAFDRSFEGAVAACAAPIVGIVAQSAFGFRGSVDTGRGSGPSGNAGALGSSLLLCLVAPWTMCLILYTVLYWTYPRDRNFAKEMKRKLSVANLCEKG